MALPSLRFQPAGSAVLVMYIDIGQKRYKVEEETGQVLDVCSCCFGESHEGHPCCHDFPVAFLDAEGNEMIYRAYVNNGWYWFVK